MPKAFEEILTRENVYIVKLHDAAILQMFQSRDNLETPLFSSPDVLIYPAPELSPDALDACWIEEKKEFESVARAFVLSVCIVLLPANRICEQKNLRKCRFYTDPKSALEWID